MKIPSADPFRKEILCDLGECLCSCRLFNVDAEDAQERIILHFYRVVDILSQIVLRVDR